MAKHADPVQKYFDSLLASYDILVEAVDKANERSLKVTRQFTADVVTGQREAIELGRKLATQPGEYQEFYTALVNSATEAQGRAIAFTQAAYEEAVAASADAREIAQKLAESNRETAKFAAEAVREYTAQNPNPWAEAVARATETFTQAAPKGREKAAATA